VAGVKESIGWAVASGVASAAPPARGFTGLEMVLGDSRAFSPALFADLGRRYVILDGYFKPYAACRMAHAAVDAVLRLVEKHRLRPAGVREIVVQTSRKGTMLGNPHPASLESAQYSIPTVVAVALHTGAVDPETLHDGVLGDPAIRATAECVRVEVDPEQAGDSELERGFPVKNRAVVVIRTRTGEHVEAVEDPRGDPGIR
jgi:2-methylcitrate dehydratase PrpD